MKTLVTLSDKEKNIEFSSSCVDTLVYTDLDQPLSSGEYVPKKDEVVAVINSSTMEIVYKVGNGEYPLTQLDTVYSKKYHKY